MENEKIFNLIEKMYSEMQKGFTEVKGDISEMKSDISEMKGDISDLKNSSRKTDIKLEEMDKKIDLSLEGHKTNREQLNRIENEVTKHEEILIRRVK